MKTLSMILSPVLLLWAACGSPAKPAAADFIPGTYVSQQQSEYSVANDTLVITSAQGTENIYLITKKTGYRRIDNGKPQAPEYKVKKLTGNWDAQKQLLTIMQNGLLISFQPEQNKLMIGSNEYWKL